MKRLLILSIVILLISCTRESESTTFPNTYLGTWRFVAKQSPGNGSPGAWSNVTAGPTMTLGPNGAISGNTFTDVTSYQLLDSATLKLIAPTQASGFYLFNFRLDSTEKALFFYIRPSNGGYCFEGCGGYRFER